MRAALWGVPIDLVSQDEARMRVCELARSGRPTIVTTPNPEILYRSRTSIRLRTALGRADLAVPDGVGVVWALRVLGSVRVSRVTGVDLVHALLGDSEGLKFFFLGSQPGVAEEAARRCGAAVVGTHHGYFEDSESESVAAAIRRSGADVILVGLGSPRQELWVYDHIGSLGDVCVMTVGGTLDVLAGRVRRAPVVWRRLGLEWLYRIGSQPARIRRALVLPGFAGRVVVDRITGRRINLQGVR